MQTWTDLRPVPPGSTYRHTELEGEGEARRFYRLRTVPAALPDFAGGVNSMFLAAEGFNTLQFAPSGVLGLIVWKNQSLIYRERNASGEWFEEEIAKAGLTFEARDYDEHRFQAPAALLFDSASRPHVLRASSSDNKVSHYVRESNGRWTERGIVTIEGFGGAPVLFAAALGSGDTLHIAAVGSGASPPLVYGTDVSGSWKWSRVAGIDGDPRGFLKQSWAPRFFSLAVNSRNRAHLTFTPQFRFDTGPGGFPKPSSELVYASNESGEWRRETLMSASDGSGDAGLGACVAVGPNDRPAVASWYDERADTGSSQGSQFLFHQRDENGRWSRSVIGRATDDFNAGDGNRGTGFAPYLRFDSRGRPHVVFSDHASEHFWASGQNEYAGQIRHGYFNGSEWVFRTVYRQNTPSQKQMIYPAMALSDSEVVFMGLERATEWAPDSWPRRVSSTYRFVFVPEQMP